MGFISTWQTMVVHRLLFSAVQSFVFPELSCVLSAWYTQRQQQHRYTLFLTGEAVLAGIGGFPNLTFYQLNGHADIVGWKAMFIVHGLSASRKIFLAYFWQAAQKLQS